MDAKEEPALAKLLVKLDENIESCNMMCGSTREFNTLALVLLTRALDVLEAVHGEEFYPQLAAVVHDRRLKRKLPVTEAQAKKRAAMKKFLP
jgi:hypothetical protein